MRAALAEADKSEPASEWHDAILKLLEGFGQDEQAPSPAVECVPHSLAEALKQAHIAHTEYPRDIKAECKRKEAVEAAKQRYMDTWVAWTDHQDTLDAAKQKWAEAQAKLQQQQAADEGKAKVVKAVVLAAGALCQDESMGGGPVADHNVQPAEGQLQEIESIPEVSGERRKAAG